MNGTNALSAEDFKLCNSFEEVRKTLMDEKYADRLNKPLAYWAYPTTADCPWPSWAGRSESWWPRLLTN